MVCVDGWELTHCIEVQVKWLVGANYLKLKLLLIRLQIDLLREEFDV